MKEVRLRLVNTGSCSHPEMMTIRGGSWRPAIFPSLVGVIRHPDEGLVLFDTGYDPLFMRATDRFPERFYRWLTPPTIVSPIGDVLAVEAIDPAEVGHIILSHFHGDHASGLRRFPRATVHCARAGLQAIWNKSRHRALLRGTPLGILPADLPARCAFFEDDPVATLPAALDPFTTAADVLGDGSILAIPLPGHCAGHWGVVLRERQGLHFLVADAAWSTRAIRDNRPAPWITGTLLGDAKAGRRTLASLHQLRMRNHDIIMTPTHCGERTAEATACPAS